MFVVEVSDQSVRLTTDVEVAKQGASAFKSAFGGATEIKKVTVTLPRSQEHFGYLMEGQYPESPEEVKRLEQLFGKQK